MRKYLYSWEILLNFEMKNISARRRIISIGQLCSAYKEHSTLFVSNLMKLI